MRDPSKGLFHPNLEATQSFFTPAGTKALSKYALAYHKAGGCDVITYSITPWDVFTFSGGRQVALKLAQVINLILISQDRPFLVHGYVCHGELFRFVFFLA